MKKIRNFERIFNRRPDYLKNYSTIEYTDTINEVHMLWCKKFSEWYVDNFGYYVINNRSYTKQQYLEMKRKKLI